MEIAVKRAVNLIKKGYGKERIVKWAGKTGFDGEEIYEIARCRLDMDDKFSIKNLYFDRYELRYSTPEIVAKYRASRVRDFTIADVSCGVGIQAIFFSFTNREVLGVDINKKRVEYARKNARNYNSNNIKFIVGDSLSDEIIKIARRYDIIFSDPARKEKEKVRKLETLIPPPLKIIEKYKKDDYIFDLPPQISMDRIPESWEKEYISINGSINRLTSYTGSLRKHDRSAVSLPSGDEIFSDDPDNGKTFILSNELSNYVYIVDESLYYSSLLGMLEKKYNMWYIASGKRRTLATSENLIRDSFLKAFKVLAISDSLDEIIRELKDRDIGKVTLRINVDPKIYWKIRNDIEKKLKGERKASLFKVGNLFIGAENVT